MPRNRVLSFMSQWNNNSGQSPDSTPSSPLAGARSPINDTKPLPALDIASAQSAALDPPSRLSPVPRSPSAMSRSRADSRQGTRPNSMIQAYQAPQVEVASDTPPELQPIFSYLNSHGNKLYQEGYFLKLHDLDSRGRPSADRTWVECFAQLVGTVLSLWDAAALDAAGVDGEVVPTFINLSDAALKMIESLPMSGAQGGRLQNVLSISTAANNRYLMHFNSLNSLTQWTAGIRLAMFEHATLQEAYTGSLIAGKGRHLNNIKSIMERSRFVTEDWARVRFGAGTPWRRLWFVITPPDEKEFQKAQKMQKKGTSYLRSQLPRGDIKFYDTRRVTKKTKPIATINDVYACYAIYPQSKPLIDQSTLIKLEGLVTIHSSPETTAEGFVFVMPEVPSAVTGFEMMLRWLFPVWDTFNLYGRPTRLIADTLDQRGLMFAMPRDRRYGYLDTLDISALIHEKGSQSWSERQWRKQMKKVTAERMNAQLEGSDMTHGHRRVGSGPRNSPISMSRPGVRFDEGESMSQPSSRSQSPAPRDFGPPRRTDSAPPGQTQMSHKRSTSEAQGYKKYQAEVPSRLSHELSRQEDYPPDPPRHGSPPPGRPGAMPRIESGVATPTLASVQAGMHPTTDPLRIPPEPVNTPPAFTHSPSSRPVNQPAVAPELRRAHSGVDAATLFQMQEASTQQDPAADEEYRQLTSQMVSPTNDRPTGRSHADYSQGQTGAIPAVRVHPAEKSPPLGTLVSSALRPESYGSATEVEASRPLPALPQEQQRRAMKTAAVSLSNQMGSKSSLSRKPVSRKPLPTGEASPARSVASTPSEHDSLGGAYIDDDALEHVLSEDARLNSLGSIERSITPDYASTASKSSHSKKSIEKPRMGKLRTTGDPALPAGNAYPNQYDPRITDRPPQVDMPEIDFGPTYSYKPTTRPATGNTTGADDGHRSRSKDRLSAYMGGSPRASPNEAKRQSYFGPDEQAGQYANQAGNRRSMIWSPGAAASPGPNNGVSAEQWVQQRAAMANQPQVAPRAGVAQHTRQSSSTSTVKGARKLMKTPPPFAHNASVEHTRQKSSTPPSRPQSRGANSYFGSSPLSGQGTSPGGLTAIEQMQVARATGTPLLSMAGQPRQENINPGLVGAVEQRERERQAAKEGLRNGQVEVAIRARQQQQMQQQAQYEAQMWAQQQHQQVQYENALRAQQQAMQYSMQDRQQLQPQYMFNPTQQQQQQMQYDAQTRQQQAQYIAQPRAQQGRLSPGGQNGTAQQQFQQDLQAAKLAYARSSENLRAARPGVQVDAEQQKSWVGSPQQGYAPREQSQQQWDQHRYN